MTGLASSGTHVYLSTVNENYCFRYDMPYLSNRTQHIWYQGYSETRDIAVDAALQVWVAAHNTTNTLRLYDVYSQVSDFIEPSLVPYASGVAVDGTGHLWVADPGNDKIYEIDLSTGVEEGSSPEFTVRAGANPFIGGTTVFIEGIPSAEVEIFDVYGRKMASGTAAGSFSWDGNSLGFPAPSGAYLVMVRDPQGHVQTLNLMKL